MFRILLWAGVLAGQLPTDQAAPACKPCPGSFLYEPQCQVDTCFHGTPRPYCPKPGDIMLRTDPNRFWTVTHNMALAFEPHGSGIVVQRSDGQLGILEAGPNDTLWCRITELIPHLMEYECAGQVWLRVRKCPLTPEQNACLTAFAERQDGKRFALIRMGAHLTLLRPRGPLRTWVMGKPRGDHRFSYFCSELVTEALVAAGLVDRCNARPAATYPHDLFYERSLNPFLKRHFNLSCDYEAPARWVSSICPE
ncbi:MAG: hypothetical protein AB7K24_26465 [Gemmataceae bacterium]